MKKNILLIGLIISIIVVLIAVASIVDRDDEVEIVHSHTTHQMNTPFENLDHLIRESVIIVSGIIRDVTDFDSTTKEYLFTIDEELKGVSETDYIYIYENTPIFDIGQKYVLFLSRWEGGLYPHPIHTRVDPANIIAIHDNQIAHNYSFLGDELTRDQFFHAIQLSRYIETEPSYTTEVEFQTRRPLNLDTMD